MSEVFRKHLQQFITVDTSVSEEILSHFEIKNAKKKELIAEAGHPCTHNYFVLKGCLHMFFTTEKGTERTVQFAIEGWWLTDFIAFQNRGITDFSIQAVELTQLLSISKDNFDELLERFPQLEKYFRSVYQIGYGASLVKMKYLFDFSKEEIYFHFTENFPEFAQRVPQKLIASFLGLTPEYVSEIRAKRRS